MYVVHVKAHFCASDRLHCLSVLAHLQQRPLVGKEKNWGWEADAESLLNIVKSRPIMFLLFNLPKEFEL